MTNPEEAAAENRELSINVVSIVAGALVVIVLMVWISVFKILCEDVMQDQKSDRYGGLLYRKVLSAVIITLLAGVIIAGLYLWKRGPL